MLHSHFSFILCIFLLSDIKNPVNISSTTVSSSTTSSSSSSQSSSTSVTITDTTSTTSTTKTLITSLKGFKNFGPLTYSRLNISENEDSEKIYSYVILSIKYKSQHSKSEDNNKNGRIKISVQEYKFNFKDKDRIKVLLNEQDPISPHNFVSNLSEKIDVDINSKKIISNLIFLGDPFLTFSIPLEDHSSVIFRVGGFVIENPSDINNGSPTNEFYLFFLEENGMEWIKINNNFTDQLFCDFNSDIDDNRNENLWREPWMIVVYLLAIAVVVSLLIFLFCVTKAAYKVV